MIEPIDWLRTFENRPPSRLRALRGLWILYRQPVRGVCVSSLIQFYWRVVF